MTTNDLTHLDCLQMLTKEIQERDEKRDAEMALMRLELNRQREELELVKETAWTISQAIRRLVAQWRNK